MPLLPKTAALERSGSPASTSRMSSGVSTIGTSRSGSSLAAKCDAAVPFSTSCRNLGRPGTHPRAVAAAPLAQAIPGSSYATVPDAIHFSFLRECQANGRAILAKEGDPDPLCDDGGSRSRADIHAELLRRVSQAFIKP